MFNHEYLAGLAMRHSSHSISPASLFLLLFFSFSTQLVARVADSAGVRQNSPVSAEYVHGGLNIYVRLIADEGFLALGDHPSPSQLVTQQVFHAGEYAIPAIMFETDAKDKDGNADLSYDLSVLKPDGSVFADYRGIAVWRGKPAPSMLAMQSPTMIHIKKGDPAGDYAVKVTVRENVKKLAVEFHLSLTVKTGPLPLPLDASLPSSVTVTGDDPDLMDPPDFVPVTKQPVPLQQVVPDYPEAARVGRVEGIVWVKILVDTLGHAKKVRVMKSDSKLLDEAALAAARNLTFSPAELNGVPVAVWAAMPFRFKLNKP
jgi:TonB family protein